ncbi:MAG: hypothetical protein PHP17_06390 [Candidatus Omnitrophica bacterium]|nr:hypothetical protein [Candidatus Omnitrophota bacterium]
MFSKILNKTFFPRFKEILFLICIIVWVFFFSIPSLPFVQESDGYMNYVPQSVFCMRELLSGRLPLWNEYQFCGTTLLNSGALNFINIGSIFYMFMDPAWAYTCEIFFYFAVLVFGSWAYFRKKGYSGTPALAGAIVYIYSGQVLFWSTYHSQNLPISLLPITLVFFIKYEETASWKWQLAAFCAVFLMCCGGFFQLTLFALLAIFIEGMDRLNVKSLLDALRRRGTVLLLGIAASSFTLFPALETVMFSHRNLVQYKDAFSPDAASLIIMSFLGVCSGWNRYSQYFFFTGMGAAGLASYALRKMWRSIISKPLFIFSVFILFFGIFASFRIIPQRLLFGVSTDPWRGMFVFDFCLAVLAAQSLKDILENTGRHRKALYPPAEFIVVWSAAIILEIVYIAFCVRENKFINYQTDFRVIGATGIVLFLGVLLVKINSVVKIIKKESMFSFLVIAFLLANVLFPSGLYLRNVFPFISRDEPWRALGIPASKISGEGRFIEKGLEGYQLESWGIYNGIRALGGYGSFFPRAIFERMLRDGLLPDEFTALTRFKVNHILSAKKLSYYGVEYLILHADSGFNFPKEGWELSGELRNGIRIFKNLKFAGRSYVTDAESKMLCGAKIVKDSSREVVISAEADKDEIIVLADSWFPGWKCYDNGRLTAGHNADGFRGYRVIESGTHEIKWVYDPVSMKIGIYASAVAFFLFLFLLLRTRINRKHNATF